MQLIDGRPVYAATDLVGFLACDHRLELERAALEGLVAKPIRNDPSIELVAKRGIEHELRYLEDLREQGRRVVEIDKDGSAVAPLDALGEPVPRDAGAELRAAAEETIAAMRGGADVVYQATFFDGTWRGHADFLLRRNHDAGEPDSAISGRGTTRSPTRSSPATSRRRRSSRSAPMSSSSRPSRASSRNTCTSSSAVASGRRTSSASTTTWPTTAG